MIMRSEIPVASNIRITVWSMTPYAVYIAYNHRTSSGFIFMGYCTMLPVSNCRLTELGRKPFWNNRCTIWEFAWKESIQTGKVWLCLCLSWDSADHFSSTSLATWSAFPWEFRHLLNYFRGLHAHIFWYLQLRQLFTQLNDEVFLCCFRPSQQPQRVSRQALPSPASVRGSVSLLVLVHRFSWIYDRLEGCY
jgi:hypothetical protein